ncbi:DUF456 domain-containing protein [Halohasta salina]|uniref:DUF456 domain-containing protein n=1 Tax=Halohasta salina TaxID=2961621 RepID=UPI0020A393ED|nr:DUF456 domain-containing protein [Halohasta salina]
MVEVVFLVAVAVLIAAVVGSLVPLVPSGLVSLAGVWFYVGFGSEPVGLLAVASLTLAGIVTVIVDQFGGPIAARASGASTEVTVASAIGGALMLFVLGPVGIVVGVVGTVLLLELRRGTDPPQAVRRSLYTAAGVLASSVLQILLTLSILVGFLVVVIV